MPKKSKAKGKKPPVSRPTKSSTAKDKDKIKRKQSGRAGREYNFYEAPQKDSRAFEEFKKQQARKRGEYKPRRVGQARDALRSGGLISGEFNNILRDREQGQALRRRLGGGSLGSAFGSQDAFGGLTGSRVRQAKEDPDFLNQLIAKELAIQRASENQPAQNQGNQEGPLIEEVRLPSPRIQAGGIITPRGRRDAERARTAPERQITQSPSGITIKPELLERASRRRSIVPQARIADEGAKFKIRESREDQLRKIVSTPRPLPEPQPEPQPQQQEQSFGEYRDESFKRLGQTIKVKPQPKPRPTTIRGVTEELSSLNSQLEGRYKALRIPEIREEIDDELFEDAQQVEPYSEEESDFEEESPRPVKTRKFVVKQEKPLNPAIQRGLDTFREEQRIEEATRGITFQDIIRDQENLQFELNRYVGESDDMRRNPVAPLNQARPRSAPAPAPTARTPTAPKKQEPQLLKDYKEKFVATSLPEEPPEQETQLQEYRQTAREKLRNNRRTDPRNDPSSWKVSEEFGFSTPPMIYNPSADVKGSGLDRGGVAKLRPSRVAPEIREADAVYRDQLLSKPAPEPQPEPQGQPVSKKPELFQEGQQQAILDSLKEVSDFKPEPRKTFRPDYQRIRPAEKPDDPLLRPKDRSDPWGYGRSVAQDLIGRGIDKATNRKRLKEKRGLEADAESALARLKEQQRIDKYYEGKEKQPVKVQEETERDKEFFKPKKSARGKQQLDLLIDGAFNRIKTREENIEQNKLPRVAKGPTLDKEGRPAGKGFTTERTKLDEEGKAIKVPKQEPRKDTGINRPINEYYTQEIKDQAIADETRIKEIKKFLNTQGVKTSVVSKGMAEKQQPSIRLNIEQAIKDIEDKEKVRKATNELFKLQKRLAESRVVEKKQGRKAQTTEKRKAKALSAQEKKEQKAREKAKKEQLKKAKAKVKADLELEADKDKDIFDDFNLG